MSEIIKQLDGGTKEMMDVQIINLGILAIGIEGPNQIASHAATTK